MGITLYNKDKTFEEKRNEKRRNVNKLIESKDFGKIGNEKRTIPYDGNNVKICQSSFSQIIK